MGKLLDLCCPDQYVQSLGDVDPAVLKSRGIDTLLLDLDNTLLPWASWVLPESSREWIARAKAAGVKLCIVSNTHNPERLARIADDIDVPSLHRALKPRRRGFARAAVMIGSQPEHTAVIGDQLLTDIVGGNRAGMYTILVEPMHRREFFGTRLSRLLEKCVFVLLHRTGRLGTKPRSNQSEGTDSK